MWSAEEKFIKLLIIIIINKLMNVRNSLYCRQSSKDQVLCLIFSVNMRGIGRDCRGGLSCLSVWQKLNLFVYNFTLPQIEFHFTSFTFFDIGLNRNFFKLLGLLFPGKFQSEISANFQKQFRIFQSNFHGSHPILFIRLLGSWHPKWWNQAKLVFVTFPVWREKNRAPDRS